MRKLIKQIQFQIKINYTGFFALLRPFFTALVFLIACLSLGIIVYEVGYNSNDVQFQESIMICNIALIILTFSEGVRLFFHYFVDTDKVSRRKELITYLILLSVVIIYFSLDLLLYFNISIFKPWTKLVLLYTTLFVQAVIEISAAITGFLNSKLDPPKFFVVSFMLIILGGSILLMLPNATNVPISFMDALFTATSAVCVTGLTTLDVAQVFSEQGKFYILLLIQIGGLGVLSFTFMLGMLIQGKSSIKQDIIIKDMLSEENYGLLFKMLRMIFVSTFIIELTGVLLLYQSLGEGMGNFKIALFHAVSAFCNAGFSTLEGNLYNSKTLFNYEFQFYITMLIVIGGIGFPVIYNMGLYISHIVRRCIYRYLLEKEYNLCTNILNTNTRLAIRVTLFLLISGTLFFYITEYDHILKNLSISGKLMTSFFLAVTPRTAGFSTYPMSMLTPLSVLIINVLMWIGASPLSTGGGIKTTTFGLAILSVWKIIHGQQKVNFLSRHVSNASIMRAFALIVISLGGITLGVCFVTYYNPDLSQSQIIFECISAISTTGLSLDATQSLTEPSKLIIIILMFIGRVGLLTVLSSFFIKYSEPDCYYPKDQILIM